MAADFMRVEDDDPEGGTWHRALPRPPLRCRPACVSMVEPLYRRTDDSMLKSVEWVGSSKEDLKRFPYLVQNRMAFAIYQAQAGLRHCDAKPAQGVRCRRHGGRFAP